MDSGLAACSLSAAVRPVFGPVDVCKCCNARNRDLEYDDEIMAANICVACGCGPMCGECTWEIPYHCCRCSDLAIGITNACRNARELYNTVFSSRAYVASVQVCHCLQSNCTVLAVRRLVYVREVGRIVALHPAFRAAWVYIARSGVRLPRYRPTHWDLEPEISARDVMLPANRPVWELVHFYQWSLRVLRACAPPDSALYLVTRWMGDL